MNKFTKIAVSFLLIFSILLNPFASILDIRANAIAPIVIEGLKFVITELVKIGITSFGVWLTSETIEAGAEAMEEASQIQQSSLSALQKGVGVSLTPSVVDEYGNYHDAFFTADIIEDVELSEEEQAFANFFVSYVNSHPDDFAVTLELQADGTYKFNLTPEQYERIRTQVTNAYSEFCMEQLAEREADQTIIDMVNNGILPEYDFSFVGPMPSISSPVMSGMADLKKDGFLFTMPSALVTREVNGQICFYFPSEASALSAGCTSTTCSFGDDTGEFWLGAVKVSAYAGGSYILYDGVVYYYEQNRFTGGIKNLTLTLNPSISAFAYYKSLDGVVLSSVYTGGIVKIGAVYNVTGEVESGIPLSSLSEDEFNQTIGGGSVELPRTGDEEIIGQAIGLGLISPDSTLEFADDGTISGADGIELAKIQELIDLISEGNLQFEDVQEYLNLITKLISTGNLTATQQKTILENIEALSIDNVDYLDKINTTLLSISESLTLEGELEDVETEFSYIDVEHHGLVEAQTIVNTALPIVAQSQQLIANVFGQISDTSYVPNFNFYWDSNKDGIVETYNFFDLSFMEQELTNSNLEDKSRYKNPMTIREFVQLLIVLIVYVLFFAKLLRRIPGLLGGSEGAVDDIKTVHG